ncbi:hypothetical protein Tco_0054580 [Tanacetum coccineum]
MQSLEATGYLMMQMMIEKWVHLNNLETTMNVSSIPTTRIHKDHLIEQIIGDLHSAPLTRRMSQQTLEELGLQEDSMEHQVDLTDFVPPTPHDSPLSPLSQESSCLGKLEDCSRLGDPKVEKESQKIGKGTKGKNSRDEALQDWYLPEKRSYHKTKPMFNDSNFDVLDDAMENVEGGSTTEQIRNKPPTRAQLRNKMIT